MIVTNALFQICVICVIDASRDSGLIDTHPVFNNQINVMICACLDLCVTFSTTKKGLRCANYLTALLHRLQNSKESGTPVTTIYWTFYSDHTSGSKWSYVTHISYEWPLNACLCHILISNSHMREQNTVYREHNYHHQIWLYVTCAQSEWVQYVLCYPTQ